jgi:large subunit ribosomal protein L9
MKIILKEEVENLGHRGDVVTVKDGYARNFLLPKSLAMRFTPGAQKVLEQERRMYDLRMLKAKEAAQAVAEKLGAVELTVAKRAGDQEVLYGSVTPTDIAELFKAQGLAVEKRRIVLREPIKKLGDYDVHIRLHPEVIPVVKLHVVKEE